MGVQWDGKQLKLCNSTILSADGFLGTFNSILNVGDVQKFQFEEGDDGPYYLNPVQCELQNFDVKRGMKKCDMTETRSKEGF